jgi:hypothetical protein
MCIITFLVEPAEEDRAVTCIGADKRPPTLAASSITRLPIRSTHLSATEFVV